MRRLRRGCSASEHNAGGGRCRRRQASLYSLSQISSALITVVKADIAVAKVILEHERLSWFELKEKRELTG